MPVRFLRPIRFSAPVGLVVPIRFLGSVGLGVPVLVVASGLVVPVRLGVALLVVPVGFLVPFRLVMPIGLGVAAVALVTVPAAAPVVRCFGGLGGLGRLDGGGRLRAARCARRLLPDFGRARFGGACRLLLGPGLPELAGL